MVAEDSPINDETQEETPARQDVDVLLDVSELEVDRIKLTVRDLRAHVSVVAELASLRDAAAALLARAGTGTVAGNLTWFAERLLDSPAVALAPEIIADGALSRAMAADAHRAGAGPHMFDAWFADYLAAEQRTGRVHPEVDVGAFGFLIAGAVHNLIVSGEPYPRPGRGQIASVLAAVAARL